MYFLYHSISLFVFWAFYQVFLKKDTFFERNRWYLLASLAAAVLAPFLEIPLSEQRDTQVGVLQTWVLPTLSIEENTSASWSWAEVVRGVYFLGVGIALILFVVRLGKLFLLIQSLSASLTAGGGSKVQPLPASLTAGAGRVGTFSFFNYLFWDSSQNLTEAEEKLILEHELAHISGGHSYDLIFIELYKIAFWFNPLIYLYEKEIRNQHEFIADQKAIASSSTENYISLMVSTLFKSLQLDLVHLFHNQQIKQRIKMLHTKKTTQSVGNAKTVLAIALVATTVILVACSKQTLPEFDKGIIAYQNKSNINFCQSEEDFVKQLRPIITRHAKSANIELEENSMAERKIVSYRDGKTVLYTTLRGKNNKKISIATPLERDGSALKISSTEESISCDGSCGCVVEYFPAQNNKPAHYACSCSPCKMRVE